MIPDAAGSVHDGAAPPEGRVRLTATGRGTTGIACPVAAAGRKMRAVSPPGGHARGHAAHILSYR